MGGCRTRLANTSSLQQKFRRYTRKQESMTCALRKRKQAGSVNRGWMNRDFKDFKTPKGAMIKKEREVL